MIGGQPTIANVSLTAATEGSYALLAGTNRFLIKLRATNATLQLAFVSGESNTTYITIPAGSSLEVTEIKGTAITLYLYTALAQTAEIVTWQ